MRTALASCALVLALGAGGLKPATLLSDQAAFEKELASLQADQSPVVVHFWATWCPPCVEEFATLGPALARVIESGGKVMLVSLDEPSMAATEVPAFLSRHGVPGASYVLADADPELMAKAIDPAWPVGALPATFVFAGGKRIQSFHGPADADAVVKAAKRRR